MPRAKQGSCAHLADVSVRCWTVGALEGATLALFFKRALSKCDYAFAAECATADRIRRSCTAPPQFRTATMPTPSRLKAPLILALTLVLLCAGVAVLVGVFGLLVKLVSLA